MLFACVFLSRRGQATLLLIALSSVLLALDNPLLDPDSRLAQFLDKVSHMPPRSSAGQAAASQAHG